MRDRWLLVGREIRAGRLAHGWSQEEVAARTGLRQANVSRDERGPAKGIDSSRLAAYIRELELDEDKILAIIHGPTVGSQDLELQVKLRAVEDIPGLSEEDRLEVQALIRSRHRPSLSHTLRDVRPRARPAADPASEDDAGS